MAGKKNRSGVGCGLPAGRKKGKPVTITYFRLYEETRIAVAQAREQCKKDDMKFVEHINKILLLGLSIERQKRIAALQDYFCLTMDGVRPEVAAKKLKLL